MIQSYNDGKANHAMYKSWTLQDFMNSYNGSINLAATNSSEPRHKEIWRECAMYWLGCIHGRRES